MSEKLFKKKKRKWPIILIIIVVLTVVGVVSMVGDIRSTDVLNANCDDFIAARENIDSELYSDSIYVYDTDNTEDGRIILKESYQNGELTEVFLYQLGQFSFRHTARTSDDVSKNSITFAGNSDIFDVDIYQIEHKVEHESVVKQRKRTYYTTSWQDMNQAQIELLQLWLADGAFSQPASVLTASLDQLDGSNAKKVYQANKQADFASFYAQCSIEPPAFPYYAGVAEPTEFVYGETAFRDEAQQLYYYIDADGQPITGKIMRYYDDSALRSVAIAVDGFAEGEIRKYYEGGESPELSLISNMKAGKLADQVSFTHYSELIDKQTATRISGEIIDID